MPLCLSSLSLPIHLGFLTVLTLSQSVPPWTQIWRRHSPWKPLPGSPLPLEPGSSPSGLVWSGLAHLSSLSLPTPPEWLQILFLCVWHLPRLCHPWLLCSFSFIFVSNLIMMYCDLVCFVFFLPGVCWDFWGLWVYKFHQIWKCSAIFFFFFLPNTVLPPYLLCVCLAVWYYPTAHWGSAIFQYLCFTVDKFIC